MDTSTQFVHLNLHTEHSLVDSIIRTPKLASRLRELKMPAVAMTDAVNLFAAVKFFNAMSNNGIKPIIGADVVVEEKGNRYVLTLLCQNRSGYQNLCQLISRAYLQGQQTGKPLLQSEWVMARTDGLLAISGANYGLYNAALKKGKTQIPELAPWIQAFPERFYLGLTRLGKKDEARAVHSACQIAHALSVPVVAMNDVRFLNADDFNAHEVRVAINQGYTLDDQRRPKHYTAQQYLRTADEMQELFSDIPSALQNTLEIAKRCNLEIEQGQTVLPAFPVPHGSTTDEFLISDSKQRLEKKLQQILSPEELVLKRAEYEERLQIELDVIVGMGFSGYFLIVADFIQWSKNNDIPVGPGRGSGAGSLVAYVLGITDLDPLEYDLLFERFLNPERVSMPDFDIDFCIRGRDRVIDYVAQKYGRGHVSQIITFGTMAAKAVVRDVARVQGHSYGFADRIAKLIPFAVDMTLDKALKEEPELQRLYAENDEVTNLLNMAKALEGIARNAGKHAGGIVIGPEPLTHYMPLYCEDGGQEHPVCQFDKDDAEKIGLVKFDFLGLKTLTIIDNAVKLIKADTQLANPEFDINAVPLDDQATYRFLASGQTKAIFQLESAGMQKLIKELEPENFDEIVALLALYRPGPLNAGMHHTFVARKHGREVVDFPHPLLEDILKPTYGVILYQEQVMQIAQILGGYSLGGADLLRRAMGKKKKSEMVKQRSIFLAGAQEKEVDARVANNVFDLMEKFADYGFNKSHSAAYALISYQTAWLKHYYPAHFMASVMSADMDHTDKMVSLKDDCLDLKIKILPPSVNDSAYRFTVAGEAAIRYGLGAIKGVGHAVIDALIAERDEQGVFNDLHEFCQRCAHIKLSRRTYEALINAGAFDCLGLNRASCMKNIEAAIRLGQQQFADQNSGMHDMFGFASGSDTQATVKVDKVEEWKQDILLSAEKQALGLYLSGHPIDLVAHELANMTGNTIKSVKQHAADNHTPVENEKRYVRGGGAPTLIAGLVVDMRKRGSRFSLVLDDDTDRIEVGLFEETYEKYRHVLVKDRILVIAGKIAFDDYLNDFKITGDKVYDLEEARDQFAGRLVIRYKNTASDSIEYEELLTRLQSSLEPHLDGNCRIVMAYQNDRSGAQIEFGDAWRVTPNKLMVENLQKILGKKNVRIQYQRDVFDKLMH
ncbi:MAG: DNA polymerase III subunit alpha [Gammaproteobacteria bacterium]|nr:DNA polymerase III subunit alpha [Gammaproteobacteria bacterium]NNM13664.1 DNA polymerase III subunit alpha [Gammaproteobacteria bacterium]